jgi:uncharacterized phage protein gp47/JayE
MSGFTPNGIELDRLDDIFDKMIADLRSLWGDNLKDTPDSVIGGFLTIIAEALADQNELIEQLVTSFQPSSAFGVFLSQLVMLNNITRNEQQLSQVDLQITANAAGTTLPSGQLVSDPNTGVQFRTTAIVVLLPFAVGLVSAVAIDSGPVEAAAFTLTHIDTPKLGWASVTNPDAAIVGFDEETDTELRARRDASAREVAATSDAGIYAAVADLQAVSDVFVHSNKGSIDDVFGVAPGAIWVVVEGSALDIDIAEAISQHLPAGHDTHGSVVTLYPNPITSQDETIRHSPPTEKTTFIQIRISKDGDFPGNGEDLITQALVDYFDNSLRLGDDVEYSRLYTPINNAAPGFEVTQMLIGFTDPPLFEFSLPVQVFEKAVTDETRITITV